MSVQKYLFEPLPTLNLPLDYYSGTSLYFHVADQQPRPQRPVAPVLATNNVREAASKTEHVQIVPKAIIAAGHQSASRSVYSAAAAGSSTQAEARQMRPAGRLAKRWPSHDSPRAHGKNNSISPSSHINVTQSETPRKSNVGESAWRKERCSSRSDSAKSKGRIRLAFGRAPGEIQSAASKPPTASESELQNRVRRIQKRSTRASAADKDQVDVFNRLYALRKVAAKAPMNEEADQHGDAPSVTDLQSSVTSKASRNRGTSSSVNEGMRRGQHALSRHPHSNNTSRSSLLYVSEDSGAPNGRRSRLSVSFNTENEAANACREVIDSVSDDSSSSRANSINNGSGTAIRGGVSVEGYHAAHAIQCETIVCDSTDDDAEVINEEPNRATRPIEVFGHGPRGAVELQPFSNLPDAVGRDSKLAVVQPLSNNCNFNSHLQRPMLTITMCHRVSTSLMQEETVWKSNGCLGVSDPTRVQISPDRGPSKGVSAEECDDNPWFLRRSKLDVGIAAAAVNMQDHCFQPSPDDHIRSSRSRQRSEEAVVVGESVDPAANAETLRWSSTSSSSDDNNEPRRLAHNDDDVQTCVAPVVEPGSRRSGVPDIGLPPLPHEIIVPRSIRGDSPMDCDSSENTHSLVRSQRETKVASLVELPKGTTAGLQRPDLRPSAALRKAGGVQHIGSLAVLGDEGVGGRSTQASRISSIALSAHSADLNGRRVGGVHYSKSPVREAAQGVGEGRRVGPHSTLELDTRQREPRAVRGATSSSQDIPVYVVTHLKSSTSPFSSFSSGLPAMNDKVGIPCRSSSVSMAQSGGWGSGIVAYKAVRRSVTMALYRRAFDKWVDFTSRASAERVKWDELSTRRARQTGQILKTASAATLVARRASVMESFQARQRSGAAVRLERLRIDAERLLLSSTFLHWRVIAANHPSQKRESIAVIRAHSSPYRSTSSVRSASVSSNGRPNRHANYERRRASQSSTARSSSTFLDGSPSREREWLQIADPFGWHASHSEQNQALRSTSSDPQCDSDGQRTLPPLSPSRWRSRDHQVAGVEVVDDARGAMPSSEDRGSPRHPRSRSSTQPDVRDDAFCDEDFGSMDSAEGVWNP